MTSESRKYLAGLRRQVDATFSISEIQMLCFDLGVDFEHLAGEEKRLKVHNLLLYLARRDELGELLDILGEERPNVNWPALPSKIDFGSEEDPAGESSVKIGDIGTNAAVAVGPGASVNVQTTNVQQYDFAGTIQGDVVISGDVNVGLEDLPIPDPPPSALPPRTTGFVGREEELSKYQEQLSSVHVAVISGIAGVGKSTLAAVLAQQNARPEKIFWHTFRPGEGIETVIWQVAGFLAHHNQDDLWQLLQRTRLTRGSPPPIDTLQNYLVEMLRGREYLLVLDDIHIIDDDPNLELFVERARRSVVAGDFSLILTSRKLPEFVTLVETSYCPGLALAATRELVANRGLKLASELVKELHEKTEGNAELLSLTIEMLRDAGNPRRLINNLSETNNVERFLLNEIDKNLEDVEPEVMSAVALLNFLGHTGTRYAIAAILEGQNVRRVLRDLVDRFLLLTMHSERGNEYEEHAIVQEFYYDALSRRQRQAMHRLAAEYYLEEELEILRAAGHLQQAGEFSQAAELLIGDVWAFINQGESRALRSLLEQFSSEDLAEDTWGWVQLSLGKVYAYLGNSEEARSCYQDVLSQLDQTPETDPGHLQRVRAYRGLGELLAQEKPQEALNWLQSGLNALPENAELDTDDEATLYLKIGTIHFWLGNYEEAKPALEKSLSILPEGTSQAKARALVTLAGVVFESESDFDNAFLMMEEALAIGRQLKDCFQISRILSTLAGFRFRAGNWSQASSEFREALEIAEGIGSDKARALSEMNLGTALLYQGEFNEAEEHLELALNLAEETSQLHLKNAILLSLAEGNIRQENWTAAGTQLRESTILTDQLQDDINTPLIHLGWAQIQMANGKIEEAVLSAQEGVALNRELEDPSEFGVSLRILGQTLVANQQHQAALQAFEESESVLGNHHPYETAQSWMHWGELLKSTGQEDKGLRLLAKARRTFESLGAKWDLLMLNRIPNAH
jgi:tetratricopeptide (TPR) repeat protein